MNEELSDVALTNQLKQRIAILRIDSERLWGKMSAAQTIAHCASGLEMALGEIRPPRARMVRLIGSAIKPKVVGNDEQLRRNSPTMRELAISGERNLDVERGSLCSLIDRFVSGGTSVCTGVDKTLIVCRRTWGETRLRISDGHFFPAALVYFVTIY